MRGASPARRDAGAAPSRLSCVLKKELRTPRCKRAARSVHRDVSTASAADWGRKPFGNTQLGARGGRGGGLAEQAGEVERELAAD